MNNKLFHIIAFAGILTCSSCSETTKEDPIIEQERVPMTFTVAVEQTRAHAAVDVSEIPVGSYLLLSATYQKAKEDGSSEIVSIFGSEYVLATVQEGGLEFPQMSEEQGESPEFYWPNDPNAEVEIYAFYTGGVELGFPENADDPALWDISPSNNEYDYVAVGMKLKTSEYKGRPVPLVFKHLMSKLMIEVKAADPAYVYELRGITVEGPNSGSFNKKSLWDSTIENPWIISEQLTYSATMIDSNYDDPLQVNSDQYQPVKGLILDDMEPVQAFLLPTTYKMKVDYAYAQKTEGDALTALEWTSVSREIDITLAPGRINIVKLGLVSDQLNIGGENGTGDSAD